MSCAILSHTHTPCTRCRIDALSLRWLWVYGALTGVVVVISFLRAILFFEVTVTVRVRGLIHTVRVRGADPRACHQSCEL